MECVPAYIYDDVENWSMSDFADVRNGSFLKAINEVILRGEQHIYNCELCTAHGFICEYCNDKQVIFPWQTKVNIFVQFAVAYLDSCLYKYGLTSPFRVQVKRCSTCGSCAHLKCWRNQCSKCQRMGKLTKEPK